MSYYIRHCHFEANSMSLGIVRPGNIDWIVFICTIDELIDMSISLEKSNSTKCHEMFIFLNYHSNLIDDIYTYFSCHRLIHINSYNLCQVSINIWDGPRPLQNNY